MTNFSTIELEQDAQGVVTLWLNRPDKNNAFNALMIAELSEALAQVSSDARARLLLLRGRGKHFSAGADLTWMQASVDLGYQDNLADARKLSDLLHTLHTLPLPTLAVVNGAAFAGALGLVSCCDMAIGAEDSLFSLSEVRLGLAPAVISPYVAQAIGARATRRYTLTADRFDAQRARELGLLAELYPEPALDSAAVQWATTLLKNGPAAMRASKALLLRVGEGPITEALRRATEQVIAELRSGEEGQEGIKAFLEKRTPNWLGANA
ncbi:enoyl-CoA hydratase-related protein [Pseudomonas sp. RIT-PI-S]|uniref:enoyl-CoA hydratase-related protein n=1 Tax=Pseudomonas sp. RIT-PI-S TaxID=3035295 RepID=UPI0021D8CFDC|nr:enoyl-CoA hydratase-related protein [Pseudomonas sp. RIT-PI-S]